MNPLDMTEKQRDEWEDNREWQERLDSEPERSQSLDEKIAEVCRP